MRRLLAVGVDTAAVLALSYIGFRLALVVAPCNDLGACPVLTPLVVVMALVLAGAYFLAAYLAWRSTPGERLTR